MTESHFLSILALFVTSVLVRIIPSFLEGRLSPAFNKFVSNTIPTAVFISFITYLVLGELKQSLVAASVAMLFLIVLAVTDSLKLILSVVLSSMVYYTLSY